MQDALPAVKRHATDFLSQLRPSDQVTVLGFNDNIFTLARRATDQAARAKAIERLAPWGGTALYDAIVHSLDLLDGSPDGGRCSCSATAKTSRARADGIGRQGSEASDATIYMIGQGRALKATALQHLMRQLAARTGGRAFFSDEAPGSRRSFGAAFFKHIYMLTILNELGCEVERASGTVTVKAEKVLTEAPYELCPAKCAPPSACSAPPSPPVANRPRFPCPAAASSATAPSTSTSRVWKPSVRKSAPKAATSSPSPPA